MKTFSKLFYMPLFAITFWTASAHAVAPNWRHVHRQPYHPSQDWSILSMDFDINADRGAARAHLLVKQNEDGEGPGWFELKINIADLSYDPATHQVIYSDGSQNIPCMTINGGEHISTGRCDFHSRVGRGLSFDGFEEQTNTFFDVYFEAR